MSPILDEFGWYTIDARRQGHMKRHHRGSLQEHSKWTAAAIRTWFSADDPRVRCISKEHADLSELCALLHDLGKAGDGVRQEYKADHPHKGYMYATSKVPFKRLLGSAVKDVDVGDLLRERCSAITPRTVAVIGVVSAMHYDLGDVIKGDRTPCDWADRYWASVHGARLHETLSIDGAVALARICLAVSMADVVGAWPEDVGESAPDSPWQRLGYPWKWAPAVGRILRAVARRIGLDPADALITCVRLSSKSPSKQSSK
jgi:hypothetical protein